MTIARPFLMFQGGVAQAAMNLYCGTFPDSAIVRVERYAAGEGGPAGTIKVAAFTLCGREFMCADSPVTHGFSFTPSSSTFVDFDTAEELFGDFNLPRQSYHLIRNYNIEFFIENILLLNGGFDKIAILTHASFHCFVFELFLLRHKEF